MKDNNNNKSIFLRKLCVITAIGLMGGFICNGIFWSYQQLMPFKVSFNILVAGFLSTLTGYMIAIYEILLKELLKKKEKR